MNDLARQKLGEIIIQYGHSLCEDPRRTEALLRDFCGEHKREINVIVSALKERVAADLLASQKGVPQEILLARLTKRLQDNLALTKDAARWAVESWALALGTITPEMVTETPKTLVDRRPQPVKRTFTSTLRLEVLGRPRSSTDEWQTLGVTPGTVTLPAGYEFGVKLSVWVDYLWNDTFAIIVEELADFGPFHLNLESKSMDEAGLAHLRDLNNLTSLDLGHIMITDAGLAHLRPLTNLTSLDLSGCEQITDAGLAHLKALTLTRLYLWNCTRVKVKYGNY